MSYFRNDPDFYRNEILMFIGWWWPDAEVTTRITFYVDKEERETIWLDEVILMGQQP